MEDLIGVGGWVFPISHTEVSDSLKVQKMSPIKRILLNVVATYGRSLCALIVGLFTARWALLALGQIDYGLLGLTGGLVVFVAFFNNLFAPASLRAVALCGTGLVRRRTGRHGKHLQ